MTPVSVYIATTEGPSKIQRIAEEDPKVHSVVCLNGTSEALPISTAYDAFVRKPTGVIEKEYGHSVFRLDVSDRISDGKSWQLGFFCAHALHSFKALAENHDDMQQAIWATGEVDHHLNVGPVEHVVEKLRKSESLFANLRAAGVPITILLPRANFDALDQEGLEDILDGIKITALDKADEIFRDLDLLEPDNLQVPTTSHPLLRITKLSWITIVATLGLVFLGATVWWGGFSNWVGMAKQGRYQKLVSLLEVAEKGTCNTCKISAKAFRVYLSYDRLRKENFNLTAVEERASDTRRCSLNRSNGDSLKKVALTPSTSGNFDLSSGRGLCTVEYSLQYLGDEGVNVWVVVSSYLMEPPSKHQQIAPVIKSGSLLPGENIAIKLTLPSWFSEELKYRVMVVATPNEKKDIDEWILREKDKAVQNWNNLQKSFQQLGLAAWVTEHVISPPAADGEIRFK